MKWNPDSYAENARFVSDLGMPIVELLSPQHGERILDLGCGDGVLAREISKSDCEVVAVDSSPEMIEAAKLRGLDARVVDGQMLSFDREFDAVFSNAALHWMTEYENVIVGVWRALRPEGRFVAEFGGYGNVFKIVSALEAALSSRNATVACPWFFPRPDDYQKRLQSAGFEVKSIDSFPRPTLLPGDIRGWLTTFAHPYTSVLPSSQREEFMSEVVNDLRGTLVDANGNWFADYVRLRFVATKSND